MSLGVASLGSALLLAFTGTAAAALPAPHVERISTAADGAEADGGSTAARVTPNGRFVAFRSTATNLVPEGITHPGTYAYVRDLRTGKVRKFEDALSTPQLSADGHYATFTDWGSHDINVFLVDLRTGERKRVDDTGTGHGAYSPSISGNGRYVAFQWTGHPQFPTRIDVYDRVTGTHETVSAGPQDNASRDMDRPSISADGRLVAYQDNGTGEVWVADRTTGAQTRADDGTPSSVVQLGANGRTVLMGSADGAYVRDLRTGRVQHFPGASARALSPDGRQLLYADAQSALHLRDLRTGADRTVAEPGDAAGATAGSVSNKGVVFSSATGDLVPDDTNGVADVFVRRTR